MHRFIFCLNYMMFPFFFVLPLFWGSVMLYLRSPKGGCCSISDDLSCSSNLLNSKKDCGLLIPCTIIYHKSLEQNVSVRHTSSCANFLCDYFGFMWETGNEKYNLIVLPVVWPQSISRMLGWSALTSQVSAYASTWYCYSRPYSTEINKYGQTQVTNSLKLKLFFVPVPLLVQRRHLITQTWFIQQRK